MAVPIKLKKMKPLVLSGYRTKEAYQASKRDRKTVAGVPWPVSGIEVAMRNWLYCLYLACTLYAGNTGQFRDREFFRPGLGRKITWYKSCWLAGEKTIPFIPVDVENGARNFPATGVLIRKEINNGRR